MADKFASRVVNRKNTAVSGDLGTVKFQLQTAVEIDPQRGISAFTRWVTRSASVLMCRLL